MKNNVYLCKPQFYYIKVGFKGVKIILVCFRDAYRADIGPTEIKCFVWVRLVRYRFQ